MGTDQPKPCRAQQPELPLPIVPPPASGQPTPDSHPHEWRLDEQTRLIGHRGIAAARALLAAHARTDQQPVAVQHPVEPPRRRNTGRAA
jgi:hypothetical protein